MSEAIGTLQDNIGYCFKDSGLLVRALTHPSYSSEIGVPRWKSNQRLEFLGDAVLELIISEYLYNKHPKDEEGVLTRLRSSMVFEQALAVCAANIKLGDYILLGVGERAGRGFEKPSILSDAFEALIGAIYLDGGLTEAQKFIHRHIIERIDEMSLLNDYKSLIQKHVQKVPGDILRYKTEAINEMSYADGFKSVLYINDKEISEGSAKSKKEAEQSAARKACMKLHII